MMKKYGLIFAIVVSIAASGCSGDRDTDGEAPGQAAKTVTLEALSGWTFVGSGEVRIDTAENALFMAEAPGSAGVTLVSPVAYGRNSVVTFKVKPATYESVNVVVIAASDKNTGGDITIPSDQDGSFGYWTQGDVQNYVFAFHNAAHERLPFIVRNPGSELLAEADSHVVTEAWHDVEIGRSGLRLWMKIDGAVIAETNDTAGGEGLPGGRIGFRLRGTGDKLASAWFKDVVIAD